VILDAGLRPERTRLLVIAVVCAPAASPSAETAIAGPADQLKAVTDPALGVLENPVLRAPAQGAERRPAIRRIADEIFDFEEMARRAMRQHSKPLMPQRRKEFVRLFADLLDLADIPFIDQMRAVAEEPEVEP